MSKLCLNDQIIDTISMHLGCAGPPCLMQTPSWYTELITVIVDLLAESRIQTRIRVRASDLSNKRRMARNSYSLSEKIKRMVSAILAHSFVSAW